MDPLLITSLQNPRIKRVAKLAHRATRDEAGQTVVEGVREVTLALKQGVIPVEAYVCADLVPGSEAVDALRRLDRLAAAGLTQLAEVSTEVFERIAYRGGSGGLLLVIPYPQRSLHDLELSETPLVVITEDAEKPGNLGAILRTADAAGVDALVVIQDEDSRGTDMNNPNVIRASLGAYFTVPLVSATTGETLAWLTERGLALVATTPEAETVYTAADLTGPVAVVMGSEARGLSDVWLGAADAPVRIPMAGAVDSLNLSTAAALVIYEALRQRGAGTGTGNQDTDDTDWMD